MGGVMPRAVLALLCIWETFVSDIIVEGNFEHELGYEEL